MKAQVSFSLSNFQYQKLDSYLAKDTPPNCSIVGNNEKVRPINSTLDKMKDEKSEGHKFNFRF